MSIRDLTYFFLWSSACVIRSIADCFSSFIRPSVRILGMVNSCIIAHTLFTPSSWKWGCRLQEPTLFKPTPQFWPPPPNTQQLQFRSLPKIELYFLFRSPLQTSAPFFSVLCVPPCVPTHIHSRSAFPHHFNWFFFFLSFLSPLLDEWLILSWSGLFLLPIIPFLFTSQAQFLLSVRWIMETNSHQHHFRHFGFWLHRWTNWWINTREVQLISLQPTG